MTRESIEKFMEKEEKNQGLYELPEGWRWVNLGEVVTHIQSGFACSKKTKLEMGYHI